MKDGLDTNEGRLDAIRGSIKRLGVVTREVLAEDALQPRVNPMGEGPAPPDKVLPHPTLRFMPAQRRATAKRGALERRVDLVLVQTVAELMQAAKERRSEDVRLVTRGDTDILGRRVAGERVDRGIEAPGAWMETKRLERGPAQCGLLLGREVALQRRAVDLVGVCRDPGQQWGDPIAHRAEDLGDLDRGDPVFEVVDKRVVAALFGLAERVGVRPLEIKDLGQPRLEAGVVVVAARLHPGAVGQCRSARHGHP